MTDKTSERAQPMKPHGDKIKPERTVDPKAPQGDQSQESIMVPEKQGGIAGP